MSVLHIFYGFARRLGAKGERCFYCQKAQGRKPTAYTYFGAPVCGKCWDEKWRLTEDGQTDPPFAEIANKESGKTFYGK